MPGPFDPWRSSSPTGPGGSIDGRWPTFADRRGRPAVAAPPPSRRPPEPVGYAVRAMPGSTLRDLVETSLPAYERLVGLGEEIEDEWSYVTALAAAWRRALEAVVARRGDEPVDDAMSRALDALAAEANAVTDPHRAIDWLSTYPQVALLALGERA